MLRILSTLATLAFGAKAFKSIDWKHNHRTRDIQVVMPPLADNSTYGNTE